MVEMISETFGEVEYVWSHSLDLAKIKKEKPDLIIHEAVERYIDQLFKGEEDTF